MFFRVQSFFASSSFSYVYVLLFQINFYMLYILLHSCHFVFWKIADSDFAF